MRKIFIAALVAVAVATFTACVPVAPSTDAAPEFPTTTFAGWSVSVEAVGIAAYLSRTTPETPGEIISVHVRIKNISDAGQHLSPPVLVDSDGISHHVGGSERFYAAVETHIPVGETGTAVYEYYTADGVSPAALEYTIGDRYFTVPL